MSENQIPKDIMQSALDLCRTREFANDTQMAVARAILAERERHGWQSIETAPKDGTKIDLWVRIRPSKMEEPESYERFPASWWDADRDDWKLGRLCWHSKFYADAHIPTHWMPLPSPPKP